MKNKFDFILNHSFYQKFGSETHIDCAMNWDTCTKSFSKLLNSVACNGATTLDADGGGKNLLNSWNVFQKGSENIFQLQDSVEL